MKKNVKMKCVHKYSKLLKLFLQNNNLTITNQQQHLIIIIIDHNLIMRMCVLHTRQPHTHTHTFLWKGKYKKKCMMIMSNKYFFSLFSTAQHKQTRRIYIFTFIHLVDPGTKNDEMVCFAGLFQLNEQWKKNTRKLSIHFKRLFVCLFFFCFLHFLLFIRNYISSK